MRPWALLALALPACAPTPDPSDGAPIETVLSEADRAAWPGVASDGKREVPAIDAFMNGVPVRIWFAGLATRLTADAFWFCREGDSACPLDGHQRVAWDRLVGLPMFSRIPGQDDYSPFWQTWVVRVPADYAPNEVTQLRQLDEAAAAGRVRVEGAVLDFGLDVNKRYVGPREALLHCLLVLAGTTLAHNGDLLLPDPSLPFAMHALEVPLHEGWNEGHRVQLFDFSVSDGALAPVGDDSRPSAPMAQIFINYRSCDAQPRPTICDLPYGGEGPWRPVSDRGLDADLDGDGTREVSNSIVAAWPCFNSGTLDDAPYSPLWQAVAMRIRPEVDSQVKLVDTFHKGLKSNVRSIRDARALLDEGVYQPFDALAIDETGLPPPRGDAVLWNGPAQVPSDFVPHPCK